MKNNQKRNLIEDKEMNLTYKIKEDCGKLGFRFENEEVLQYLLSKNIYAIFGKENFLPIEMNINKLVGYEENFAETPFKLKNKTRLQIMYGDLNCEIYTKMNGTILEMIDKNSLVGFQISITDDCAKNNVIYLKGADIIQERQTIHFGKEKYFTYQKKELKENGEDVLSPTYKVAPYGIRRKNETIFYVKEIEKENEISNSSQNKKEIKSAFKNNIYNYFKDLGSPAETFGVPFANSSLGINADLSDIFYFLEKKTEKNKVFARKLEHK